MQACPRQRNFIGRMACTEERVKALLLASDDFSYLTHAGLLLDGSYVAQ